MARIGIYGGSFDPIHYGHLILAETCREFLRLDTIFLIPAAQSPLKPNGPIAADMDRLEMCRRAVVGSREICVDPIELTRGGVSYTLDTVREIQCREFSKSVLSSNTLGRQTETFLLVGADSVAQFADWKQPADLLSTVQLGVTMRAGHASPDFEQARSLLRPEDRQAFNPTLVPMPLLEISSSDLRRRIACGQSVRYRLPGEVESYIYEHGLYGSDESSKP
jgi:nicotinate-nucleotide adenylyltransferase